MWKIYARFRRWGTLPLGYAAWVGPAAAGKRAVETATINGPVKPLGTEGAGQRRPGQAHKLPSARCRGSLPPPGSRFRA